ACRMYAAFLQRVNGIDGEIGPAFFTAIGPANLDPVDAAGAAESEMDAKIILRKVAAPAAHFLPLRRAAAHALDARADRVAIRRDAHELQQHPVARPASQPKEI